VINISISLAFNSAPQNEIVRGRKDAPPFMVNIKIR